VAAPGVSPAVTPSGPDTIARALAEAAAAGPDRIYLRYRGREVSYAQLQAQVTATALRLVALGVNPGDRVAVWAANTLGAAVALLALPVAGAQIVPLNTRYQFREAEQILTSAGCRTAIAPSDFLGRALADEVRTINGVELVVALDEDGLEQPGTAAELAAAVPELQRRGATQTGADVALIQYTSGTTGRPKGALLRQGPMLDTARIWTREVGLGAGDVFPIGYPLAHIGGFKTGLLTTLVSRATAVLFPVVDSESLIAALSEFPPAVISAPPPVLRTILDAVGEGALPASIAVRTVITGSAIVSPGLVHDLRAQLRVTDVINAYGLTEATGVCTMTRRGDAVDLVCETIGRPIDGVEVRVAGDSPGDDPTVGELEVRGPNVMLGYLDDADATADAMHDGWLRTGDLGRIRADGYVSIVGRAKDMVVVGGFNVYPAEVEQVLAGHPAVAEAAAIGVPDERLGEVVVVFLVPVGEPAGPDRPSDEQLTTWCRAELANFKVPRRFWWVDDLPRAAAGKVAKADLHARARAEMTQA
jgi:acyl-CoA synthetase (AMP-forming)/AMP-acid ligase II